MTPSRGNVTINYYNCNHMNLFEQEPACGVALHNINGHTKAPYAPFAVIKPAQCASWTGRPRMARLQLNKTALET
jgi:hypothetical protein